VPYRDYLLGAVYAGSLVLLPIAVAAQTSSISLLPDGAPVAPSEAAAPPPPAPEVKAPQPQAPAAQQSTRPPAPAAAAGAQADTEQVNITAPRSSGIAAIVNDTVISDYDLDQRTALFAATSGIRPTKESLAQIRVQVLRSLEDEILELQEAAKHKINITKADVDKALKNIADDNHLTPEQILATITQAGVSADVFRQQLAAQLTWQRLVAARYGTDVLINDQ